MYVQVCHTFGLLCNGKFSDVKSLKLSSLIVELSHGLLCVDPLIILFFSSCAYIRDMEIFEDTLLVVSAMSLVLFSRVCEDIFEGYFV